MYKQAAGHKNWDVRVYSLQYLQLKHKGLDFHNVGLTTDLGQDTLSSLPEHGEEVSR